MKSTIRVAAFLTLLASSPALGGDLEDAQALHKAGKFQDALPKYEAAVKADPKNPAAALGLSQVLAGLGRFDEAAKAVDAARKANPGNAQLMVAKARACLLAAGKEEQAEEPDGEKIDALKLDVIKWVDEALKADAKFADALVLRGQIHQREGNEEQAILFWEEAVKADPQSFDANFALAEVWFKRAQNKKDETGWAKSGPYFEAAFKIDPTSGAAALGVARSMGYNKAPPKDVVNAYLRAADLIPDDDAPLRNAYQWCPRSERVQRFRMVSEAMPKHVRRKMYYAFALREDKQFEAAVAVLAEAAQLEPKNAYVAIDEGDAKLAWGKFDEAMASYKRAMEIFHGKIDDATFNKLVRTGLSTTGLYAEQREKLWTMLWENFPDRYELANNLGLYYRDNVKDYKKSLEWYLRAAEVATEDVCVQNDTGLVYDYHFEDYEKAEPYYRRAIELGKEQNLDFRSGQDPDRGYRDAIGNVARMLVIQKRWADLKAFCEKDVPATHPAREEWLKKAAEQKAEPKAEQK